MLNFISKLQLPTKILFGAIFIVSSLMLFIPMSILSILGLTEFVDKHRAIIGVCFLVSLAVLILFLLGDIKDFISTKLKKIKCKKYLNSILKKPTSNEYELLYNMYSNNMELVMPKNNKSALYLELNKIILIPKQYSVIHYDGTQFVKYIVKPWASKIIEKHFKKSTIDAKN